jgi:putative hydrolase of the HAD superfamily
VPDDVSNLTRGYRWLVFDAVGTLIFPTPSVAEAYQAIAARHGSRITTDQAKDRFRTAFRQSETDQFPGGPTVAASLVTNDQIEVARWQWIVRQVIPDADDMDACFRELWDHFARPSSWLCFPDVAETLEALRSNGVELAIASNFDSRLHSICVGDPALKQITRRYVSSETGFRKPAAEFYRHLISDLGCSAEEILMVGDDQDHDVAGPRAAGMKAVYLDRSLKVATAGSIGSLIELIDR